MSGLGCSPQELSLVEMIKDNFFFEFLIYDGKDNRVSSKRRNRYK